jgi:hypothetical protein
MMWKHIIGGCVLGCTAVLVTASGVDASPFCVQVTGIPLQCLYADPASCQKEANRQGGICASNPAEFKTPVGGAGFCVVQSGTVVSCAYTNRGSCNAEAGRVNGACVAATPAPPSPTASAPLSTDLFEVKRPY